MVASGKNIDDVTQKLKTLILNQQEFTWKGIEEFSREKQAEALNKYLEMNI